MKRIAGALLAGGLAVLVVGCQQAPTAEEVLNSASEKMASVSSLQFSLERQGDPAVIDLGLLQPGLVSAAGVYQSPDQVHATLRLDMGGSVSEGEVLWATDGTFAKLPPLMPNFTSFDLGDAFNAPGIFSAETGLPGILTQLENPTMVGEEDVDGVATYHVSGQANGENLTGLTGAPLAEGAATVDVWVAKDTNYVVRAQVTESDGNGWLLDFFGFDEPVEIPTP